MKPTRIDPYFGELPGEDSCPPPLSPEDRALLELESRFYRSPAAKVLAVRDELGLSETGYARALNRLLDDPQATFAYPQLIVRLRRLRASRVRQRSARRS